MTGELTRKVVLALLLLVGVARAGGAQAPVPLPGDDDHLHDMKWRNTLFVLVDELEIAPGRDGRPVALDARLWYGGAVHRVWMRAEGDRTTSLPTNSGDADLELLYGRLVHPFWDAVIGARVDRSWGGDSQGRAHFALGLIGLAPYRFELEPTLYVSERGDVSARLKAEYAVLLTHRLIAEPAMEVNAALQRVPQFGVRSGFNDYTVGVRLRYELMREVAPYVGWTHTRRIGQQGEGTQFVTGLRLWY